MSQRHFAWWRPDVPQLSALIGWNDIFLWRHIPSLHTVSRKADISQSGENTWSTTATRRRGGGGRRRRVVVVGGGRLLLNSSSSSTVEKKIPSSWHVGRRLIIVVVMKRKNLLDAWWRKTRKNHQQDRPPQGEGSLVCKVNTYGSIVHTIPILHSSGCGGRRRRSRGRPNFLLEQVLQQVIGIEE